MNTQLTVANMCVDVSATIQDVLRKISTNKRGLVFVLKGAQLVGSISDGDIRRQLTSAGDLGNKTAGEMMNENPVCLPAPAGAEETFMAIVEGASRGVSVIPRVREGNRVVGFTGVGELGVLPISDILLGGNELDYVLECLRTNWISSSGPFVPRFEEAFGNYIGADHAVSTTSGTTALTLALVALGLPPGMEVIVPNVTFGATANAVLAAGGVPVFADLSSATWGLSVESVASVKTTKTWGVIGVHLYGSPFDSGGIRTLCDENGWLLIEDCAEAIGSYVDGQHVGARGDAAAFSFFGNKTLTMGEGGLVTFRSSRYADRARKLRDHGMSRERKYWHETPGFNMRVTNLQAAIGLAQVERVDWLVEKKYEIARNYEDFLDGAALRDVDRLPVAAGSLCSFWLYPIQLTSSIHRDNVAYQMASHGIQTRPVFPCLSEMPAFSDFPKANVLSVSESISNRGLCLPSTPNMTPDHVEWVVKTLAAIV